MSQRVTLKSDFGHSGMVEAIILRLANRWLGWVVLPLRQ